MNTAYSQTAAKVISESGFHIQPGNYVYVKVSSVATENDHFLVTRDADEITVVTREESIEQLPVLERNKDSYRLISLNVSVPFYSVGFLATVSDAFARKGMNILIVSTYSKDYILIRADLIEKAETILLALGFKKTG